MGGGFWGFLVVVGGEGGVRLGRGIVWVRGRENMLYNDDSSVRIGLVKMSDN